MSEETSTIGARVALLCRWGGVESKSELMRLAGLASHQHARQLLLSKDSKISAVTALKLASAFGASVEWIALGTGKGPTQRGVSLAVKRARESATSEVPSCE